ncbi:unnamed protein product [Rotaria socialis]|uniref:Uncharacterized protein n=2 Tax=Rotaria socialis TaxID=392032 RepID=A0A818JS19_9BILA|nr:unnamed protein product [Rotaria socialis]CAF3703203.1 unnamed protein product [Rotaria socialis]
MNYVLLYYYSYRFNFNTMSSIESAQKALLAEVAKKDYELKHVQAPTEPLSTTQAKMLIEVQGGKYELNHVDNPPKDGLTEAEKQAYLEERQKRGN